MSKILKKLLCFTTAFAIVLSVGVQLSSSFSPSVNKVHASEKIAETTEGMIDPAYQMISFGEDSSMKIMSDGTVHGTIVPTPGFGGRANLNGLGDDSRYDIAEGVTIEIHNFELQAEATFTIAMQTVSTGTIGGGNGGGLHVGFRVMKEGENHTFALIVWNNKTDVQWAPTDAAKVLPAGGNTWKAETIKLTFTNSSITVDWKNATTGDYKNTLSDSIQGFENLCADFKDDVSGDGQYHSTKPYLSFSCYHFVPEAGVANFDLVSVNGKTPLDEYKAKLDAKINTFVTAVDAIANEQDAENIQKAVNQNMFGKGQAYGILLENFGTEEQKTKVNKAVEKLQSLNGEKIYNKLKSQVDAFIVALNDYNKDVPEKVDAAINAYNGINWALRDELNETYKPEMDKLLTNMTGNGNFKACMLAFADNTLKTWEKAASAEFNSSKGYNTTKQNCEGWDNFKTNNFITAEYLTQESINSLDARVNSLKEKLTASIYNDFIYRGMNSELKIYEDTGLYMNLTPDVYPALDNAVSFKNKMTLNTDSEISFNLIYALRKLGAFQMQIGFYPVAGAMSKGDHDGVRVDFWTSAAGTTEIKPVNGKTELPAYEGAHLSLTDEDFFDFGADTLDYSVSDYKVKLCSNPDGSLYISVNDLEMDITGEGLNADLYKDGVYITITGVGVKGTKPFELLVSKVGSTQYRVVEDKDNGSSDIQKPDSEETEKPAESGCSGCSGNIGAMLPVVGILTISAAASFVFKKRQTNK